MLTKKFISALFALFLVSCSAMSAPILTPEESTPTFVAFPSSTFQLVETVIPSPTSSEVTPSSIGADSCMKTARTQLEMNQCAGQGLEGSKAKLDALLMELKSHMSDAQYQLLFKVQEEWKTSAEDHCAWEANFFEGGSIQSMIHALCLNVQYLDRIDVLRLNLCEGHGMTGECEESLKYKR